MEVVRKKYSIDDFNEILDQIHQVISHYRFKYNREPIMIFLSPNLRIGIRYCGNLNLEYNPLNNVQTLFGIECKESPVLVDLEYKVY